jgi:transposase
MHSFTLSLSERRALEKQIRETKDVKILKRAQAFLWFLNGIAVQEIAKRVGVTRQTIYVWVSLFHSRCNMSFRDRLRDAPKLGRPPRKSTRVLQNLDTLLRVSPRNHGYRYAEWTSSLVQQALQCEQGRRKEGTDHVFLDESKCQQVRDGIAAALVFS